jgi:hypothetical protein
MLGATASVNCRTVYQWPPLYFTIRYTDCVPLNRCVDPAFFGVMESEEIVLPCLNGSCRRPVRRPTRSRAGLAVLALLWFSPGHLSAGTESATAADAKMAPLEAYLAVDQATEVALARSAAPRGLAQGASVLTLGRSGYESAVKGSNGFVCLVGRSWQLDFDDPEFWNPKIAAPECWNAAAVSSVLPGYLKRTQWVLAGLSRKEMAARTKAAWAAHEFVPPAPLSMFYMLSKAEYIRNHDPAQPDVPWPQWYPHLVFMVPATAESAWGANVRGSPTMSTTSDVEPITNFFVVVPRWSDGSLYPYPAPRAASASGH